MAWIRAIARAALILATATAALQRPRFRLGITVEGPGPIGSMPSIRTIKSSPSS
jgi:hypothetical protein